MGDVTVVELFARLGVSLVVVLGVMWLAAAVLRRTRGGSGPVFRRRSAPVEVLARQPVGRRSSVTVVRAGDRALVLGVTDASVTLLLEADAERLLPPDPGPPGTADPLGGATPPAPAWTGALDALRERTVRRPPRRP